MLEFACPNCNGDGDCACGGNGYCYGQKCLDCISPTTVNTDAEGTIIDDNPKAGDRWKFRVRSCTDGVSYPEQDVNIFAERPDGTKKLVLTINNRDGEIDSFGRTLWSLGDEECFRFLVAQKMVGDPDEVQLCMEKEAAGNPMPPPGCEPPEGLCDCPNEMFDCEDDPNLAYAVRTFGPINAPPANIWKWKDNVTAECRAKYVFRWWRDTQSNGLDTMEDCGGFESNTFIDENYAYYRLLMWKPGPGGGWTDVTEAYVEGLPYEYSNVDAEIVIIPDGLRFESVITTSGCTGIVSEDVGSEGVYQGLAPPPCEIPDLNVNCPQSRNMRSENPLP